MARRVAPIQTLAVAYLRVSTEDQSLGPEGQRKAIIKWCSKNGVTLACDPFVDQGISGGLDFEKRPGLVQALDAMKHYNAALLVAQKRDRLARGRDVIGNLSMMLHKSGRRICTTEQPLEGKDEINPMGKAMEGISDVFAELERSMIRARTKTALSVKRSRGERVGTIPYGYRLLPDGVHIAELPEEQRVIKIVRGLRESGLSLRAIIAELDRRGIKPRSKKLWHPPIIKNICEYDHEMKDD